jgi:hypothetical protein
MIFEKEWTPLDIAWSALIPVRVGQMTSFSIRVIVFTESIQIASKNGGGPQTRIGCV